MQTLKVIDLLTNAAQFHWGSSVYLPNNETWNLETKCLVFRDSIDNLELTTNQASVLEMYQYWSSIQILQDVINNAQQQNPNISLEVILKAWKFYERNDAFLDLELEIEEKENIQVNSWPIK